MAVEELCDDHHHLMHLKELSTAPTVGWGRGEGRGERGEGKVEGVGGKPQFE